jgi:hypothetical protein
VVISNRERMIGIGVAAVIGLFLLDHMLYEPYVQKRAELIKADQDAAKELTDIDQLKNRRRNLMESWDKMVAAGMKTDLGEAQNRLDRAIRDWQLQAGVTPEEYNRKEPSQPDHGFQKTKAHLVATGNMKSVSSFLWALETTLLPIRIDDMNITSLKEGTDSLKLEMDLSLMVPLTDQKAARTTVADIRGY